MSFGQVNWDLRCRCLEQAVNKPSAYSFRGRDTRTPYNRTRSVSLFGQAFPVELFRKGNVTNLSNSALDPGMPANSNMHAPSDSHANCGAALAAAVAADVAGGTAATAACARFPRANGGTFIHLSERHKPRKRTKRMHIYYRSCSHWQRALTQRVGQVTVSLFSIYLRISANST